MKPELLKTSYIAGLTRKQLEERIRIVEAELKSVTTERDSYKLEVEKYKPHVGLNERLKDALEALDAKFERVEPLHRVSHNVVLAYRAVRDGAG
jgi:hypothetical protein